MRPKMPTRPLMLPRLLKLRACRGVRLTLPIGWACEAAAPAGACVADGTGEAAEAAGD